MLTVVEDVNVEAVEDVWLTSRTQQKVPRFSLSLHACILLCSPTCPSKLLFSTNRALHKLLQRLATVGLLEAFNIMNDRLIIFNKVIIYIVLTCIDSCSVLDTPEKGAASCPSPLVEYPCQTSSFFMVLP